MTIQKLTFNLDQMWDAVLSAPNVRDNPKNVKVGNLVFAALEQKKLEGEKSVIAKAVLSNVAHQLVGSKKKDLHLATFANRLVHMAEFQRRFNYKERLALRNACDSLAGKRFLLMRSIRNALYEFGVSVKRSWEGTSVSWRYNVKLESGLRKLLASRQPVTKMSEKKLRQKLEEWFPPLHRHVGMGGIFGVSEKTRRRIDEKMANLRQRLYDIIKKTPKKAQIPNKIEKLGQEIESKK